MLVLGMVPTGFGCGLFYPIPKNSNRTVSASTDDFRIITVYPILSNFFEYYLLAKMNPLLKSHPRQFGFKAGTG